MVHGLLNCDKLKGSLLTALNDGILGVLQTAHDSFSKGLEMARSNDGNAQAYIDAEGGLCNLARAAVPPTARATTLPKPKPKPPPTVSSPMAARMSIWLAAMNPEVPLLGPALKAKCKRDAVARIKHKYAGRNGDVVNPTQYPATSTWQALMLYFASLSSDVLLQVIPLPLPTAFDRPSVLQHIISRRPIVIINLLSQTPARMLATIGMHGVPCSKLNCRGLAGM
jgi:hypothetical protein